MATAEQQAFLRSLEEEKSTPARAAAARQGRFMVGAGGGLSVTVARAAAQNTPVNAGPINFTVTFNRTVTGFTNADVSFAGSTVGGTLAAAVTGTNPYNVAVTGMTGIGNVTVSVPAGAATDAAGNLSPGSTAATVMFGTALPLGVSLQAIDGERILGLSPAPSMSHDYFASNGFTYAVNAATAQSWDDPAFFPCCCFFGLYTQDIALFLQLGLNVSISVTGDSDMNVPLANRVWTDSPDSALTPNATTCALHIEEDTPANAIPVVADAVQAGRFWEMVYTFNGIVGGDIGGEPMSSVLAKDRWPTPAGSLRSVDMFGTDIYWMAGSTEPGIQQQAGCVLSIPMGFTFPTATLDQMSRGSNYGNMIDVFRSWGNGTNSTNGSGAVGKSGATSRIPLLATIENLNGLVGPSGRNITPPEFNWATWSSVIHGARGMNYFTDTGHLGGWPTSVYSGQTISMHDQCIATTSLLKSLAPVINSPFALGYCSATPHGYTFPIYEENWLNGGIETMAKLSAGKYYVFATTRNSAAVVNTAATFTIKNTGGTIATVINEARTIPITGSGTTFTDTFAAASTVHIYRID